MNVDLTNVLKSIRVRPTHKNIMSPGLGVGGYCLTKDPLFGIFSSELFLKNSKVTFPLSTQAIKNK